MTNTKSTKRALLASLLILVMCLSMFVGTTFAWFTDEVVTGMNTIAAGNLDIELYANGQKVESATKLFDDVTLWEPGVVVYENLQVANVGTLALKYQMTLNFGNENDLNGHKLSEVLKVAVLEDTEIVKDAAREEVLALAQAEVADDQGNGTLSNFYLTGKLDAKAENDKMAIVIFWAPNANATDNLYNANNGQDTSDGKPLHIEFGVNLQATQKMSEEDSFGSDYDEFASILPKATVNDVSAQYPTVTATAGIGGNAEDIPMDFALQFLSNEKLEEAKSSQYRYWHADYVIKADRDVPANSIALAGYYHAWCQFNNDNWVALTSDQDIAANTEIRLVSTLGATVNYEEICNYGVDDDDPNTIDGFLCGATDLTGANVGTTITVELRMYEVDENSSSLSTTASETGHYEVIGKYTYTFGAFQVKTAEELKTALANGVTEIKLGADIDMGSEKLTVAKDVVLDLNGYVLSGTCNAGQGHMIMVNNGAALDIKDSSSAKTGKITYAQGSSNTGWAIDLEGELNLHSGTIELTGDSWDIAYCVDVRPNAWGTNYTEDTVFTMNGGKLVSSFDGIRVASSSSDTYGNIVASFVMNGGIIDAARDGIFMQQSNAAYDTLRVAINNGTVKGTRPIRVFGPDATSVNASTEKPMTITAKSDSLVLVGALDSEYTWHTEGKIAYKGGMTLDNLNNYATITLN